MLCFVNIHTKPWPHEKGTETKLCFLMLGSNLRGLEEISVVCFEMPRAAQAHGDVHTMLELWMASVFVL